MRFITLGFLELFGDWFSKTVARVFLGTIVFFFAIFADLDFALDVRLKSVDFCKHDCQQDLFNCGAAARVFHGGQHAMHPRGG